VRHTFTDQIVPNKLPWNSAKRGVRLESASQCEGLSSMSSPAREHRLISYAGAVVIGILAVSDLMPLATIAGTGGMWSAPDGDMASSLSHLQIPADSVIFFADS
jgi:hypothetical protein